MNTNAQDVQILDEVSEWLARWYASDFGEDEQAALTRWRSQSPQHEEVWQRAKQLTMQLRGVPSDVGMRVLDRPRSRARRQTLRVLALMLTAPAIGWLAYRHTPWQHWTADFRTAEGDTRVITLVDQSELQLNTGSAVNVRFDESSRRIQQYAGEIFIQTAQSSMYSKQPFIVETVDGEMQALGTIFMVRKHAQGTTLSVFQGAVRITPAHLAQEVIVHAGHQVRFDAHHIEPIMPLARHADAWRKGVLYAENMRLDDFLKEIARYREGVLLCDDSVAERRISGTYQLHDTDRILELLAETHDIRLIIKTRYWITATRA